MLRDEHRLRERLELQLDERQVPAIALGALLLLGGVFALGVLVGKSLAGSAPVPHPVGNLEALDAAKEQAAARKAAAEKAEAERKAAEEREERQRAAAEKAAQQKAEKDKQAKAAEKSKAEAREHALATAAAKRVEPADGGEEEDDDDEAPKPPAAETFTVQIGASQDQGEAERLVAKGKAAGLAAYVAEANLGDKGTWYRVRVGNFNDKAAAERYRRDVERELGGEAVVMSK